MGRNNNLMAEVIFAPVHPELKKLLEDAAQEAHLDMNVYLAKVLAEHFKRPDIGWIPRKKRGPKTRRPKQPDPEPQEASAP